MKNYLQLLNDVLASGVDRPDRTGTGTRSVFGRQMRFDLSEGFPLMTTKKLPFTVIANELLWFLRGDTNVRWLQERNVRIWNEWADKNGDLGPVYGAQWRSWPANTYSYHNGHVIPQRDTLDQIAALIKGLKTDPYGRRHIVSAWNVADLGDMALAPCHCLFQFYVAEGRLSCQLYQRSADMFLGVPFNIASYALLTHMIAQVVGLKVGEFIHTFGDAHVYDNHVDAAHLQMRREPKQLPRLVLNPAVKSIDDFVIEDMAITGYDPDPHIRAAVAV